jgi:hypothetical protein
MKAVAVKKINIEVSLDELKLLFAGIGCTSNHERQELLARYGLKVKGDYTDCQLYEDLGKALGLEGFGREFIPR